MRRAIVHIGLPRTGSTTLQELLADLRPKLAESGVCYPVIAPEGSEWSHVNHQPFGETLDGRRPRRERTECLDVLSRRLAETRADTVLLSYEDFSLQQRRFRVPDLLRSELARHGFRMEVLVVVKPQSEHLNSYYTHRAQLIREKRRFGEFARAVWTSQRFDYDYLIEPWVEASGGRVVAIPMRDRRSDAPLLDRIFDGIGLGDQIGNLIGASERATVKNRSSGPLAVEASRRLRRMRVREQARVPPREIGRFLDRFAEARGWDPETFRGDDPVMMRRIDERHAESNDRFGQTVWGRPWQDVVAYAPPRPPNELSTRVIDPEAESRVQTLVSAAIAHHGFKVRPGWWCAAVDLVETGVGRLLPAVGVQGWRVP
ncbi:hypothetical protein [uncultured Enterovirga sp.]|uniref:hypothetical protein n=1 Tax=uncultured Enterovirga sp. TaxID=2026352 RepID=UPI0035CB870F